MPAVIQIKACLPCRLDQQCLHSRLLASLLGPTLIRMTEPAPQSMSGMTEEHVRTYGRRREEALAWMLAFTLMLVDSGPAPVSLWNFMGGTTR